MSTFLERSSALIFSLSLVSVSMMKYSAMNSGKSSLPAVSSPCVCVCFGTFCKTSKHLLDD